MKSNPKKVIIGLGSNLNDPVFQLKAAIKNLKALPELEVLKVSSFYSSSPQGPQDQDDYVNAVALIQTTLSPQALLLALQSIEQLQGRIKTRHWGERSIDLDIVFIEQECMQLLEPDLIVPHPYALERDFVVLPCLEICPDWKLPDGSPLSTKAAQCAHHGLSKLAL